MNKVKNVKNELLLNTILYLNAHETETVTLMDVIQTGAKYLVYSGIFPKFVNKFVTRQELVKELAEFVIPELKGMMDASGYEEDYHKDLVANVSALVDVFANMIEDYAKELEKDRLSD